MSCFGFLEKFILERCYPPGGPAGQQTAPTQPQISKIEPTKPKVETEKSYSPVVIRRKHKDEEENSDELFREMEPRYVAPKRVNLVVMANENELKSTSNQSKTRFDMEEGDTGNWGEDFKLD
ncbi:unnamed protein product [Blepharisma stoltei]|uniref:Uncharacterized protein n=1 Tax=Blepharisma stoltei TaxID=1481888 RepID=A0AAU9K7M1_9CILI|nr:unnamed protein product [Blepharisma stoltei]